jgi:hypothetical protein
MPSSSGSVPGSTGCARLALSASLSENQYPPTFISTPSPTKRYSAPPPIRAPIAISRPVSPAIRSHVRVLVAKRVAVMFIAQSLLSTERRG